MMTTTAKTLRRRLLRKAQNTPVTVDDAADILQSLGERPKFNTIRSVLRTPDFRPVGWTTTTKPSRHGRPVRKWRKA